MCESLGSQGVTLKITVSQYVTPCSLVDVYQLFSPEEGNSLFH
jgi:hypothetical protein